VGEIFEVAGSTSGSEPLDGNWQMIFGKFMFAPLRMCGPQEPWFSKTWRPGEPELVEWVGWVPRKKLQDSVTSI
jgi:hypothetical protein